MYYFIRVKLKNVVFWSAGGGGGGGSIGTSELHSINNIEDKSSKKK